MTLPLLVLFLLSGGPARAETPVSGVDTEAPAVEPKPSESIWDYIEADRAPTATDEARAATEELAAERLDELAELGAVGAEPPVEYYLDPVAATDKDPLHLDKVNPKEFDIPVVVNDDVKRWMEYFLGRGRKYYTRYLARSTRWLPMMHAQISARGLPKDLVYLSMIESGFSPGAYSYASAVGLWQFMSATGRQYGMRIDYWVDERRDPERATKAALDYLSYLNKLFDGDWWLAWASYNGGEGRVMNATRRYGTTDFWKITTYDYLHTETENYVPKLIAAAIIGKHPERYGFVDIDYVEPFRFERVDVPASTPVEVLARCAGINEEAFLELNPSLRQWSLPPDPETQSIRIPVGATAAFKEAFAKVPPAEKLTYQRHTVRRGESLGSIARKYGVSTEDLARLNHLKNANVITVGMSLVVPAKGGAGKPAEGTAAVAPEKAPAEKAPAEKAPAEKAPAEKAKAEPVPVTSYTVRSGDTLASIARAKGVSVDQLQGWNGIKDENTIYVGQKLTLKAGAAAAEPAPAAPTTTTVKAGDTLSAIAAAHGVSVEQLKTWNKLSGSTITVGQRLVVKGGSAPSATPGPSAKSTSYTVKRGDTLGTIAERYNCTVAELKAWNGISGNTIYPGQKLSIRQ